MAQPDITSRPPSEVILLGTGTSEGVPRLSCLVGAGSTPPCNVCTDAMKPGSKNRRRNTGAIIRTHRWEEIPQASAPSEYRWVEKIIMIDCGKFWWHTALEHFSKLGIKKIDAILVSHAHADAIGGFDDLRDLTRWMAAPLPIYLRHTDLDYVKLTLPYLTNPSTATGSGFVPTLNFISFDPTKPVVIEGLPFVPLVVDHGPNYTALGFKFGNVVYISDCNAIPAATRELIKQPTKEGLTAQPLELLVLDALRPKETHSSHYCLDDALNDFREFRPKLGLVVGSPFLSLRSLSFQQFEQLVSKGNQQGLDKTQTNLVRAGMNHEFDHDTQNAELRKLLQAESLNVALAYDTQIVPVDFL